MSYHLLSLCLLLDIDPSPFFRTNHTQLSAERGDQVNDNPVYIVQLPAKKSIEASEMEISSPGW